MTGVQTCALPICEYFVFRNAAAIKAAELSAAAKAAQTAGKGWGNGTIDVVKRNKA